MVANSARGKLQVRQRIIDEQVQNLAEIRAKEQAKFEREMKEIKEQQETTVKEIADKKKAQLDDVKRTRLLQIKEKEEALQAKLAIDRLYAQQAIEAEQKRKEADEKERIKKLEKVKENQQAILQQIAEKQKVKVEELVRKTAEANELKQVLQEDQQKFKEYTNNRLLQWDDEKKPVVKIAMKKIS